MGDLYLEWEYWVTFAQLAMAMLAMGATLAVDDFVAVVRLPRSMATGLVVQLVVVPAVVFALLRSLELDAGVAVGIAILAAVPGGTVSNVFTYAARGNVPLSIAVTAATTLACIVTVPLVLDVLIGPYVPPGFTLPRARIAAEIVATLLVPLAAGMAMLRWRPELAARVSRWALRATALLIVVIVAGSAAAGRLDAEAMGVANLALVAALAAGLCVVGGGASVLARRPRGDVVAIAIETTVRNTNLGLLIRATLFTSEGAGGDPLADLALFTILAFAGISFVLAVPLILLGRRADAAERPGPAPAGAETVPTT